MKNTSLIKLFILSILLSFSSLSMAHFHYELSVKTHFQANDNNQLTSIKIEWVYDNNVSNLMLKDQQDMKKLGEKLIDDLAKLNYFTAIKLNKKPLEVTEVKQYQLEEIKHKNSSNLKLTFTLPLQAPVNIKGKNTLSINHEDAMASAIIFYDNVDSFTFDSRLESKCKGSIIEKKNFEEGESPQITKVICQ